MNKEGQEKQEQEQPPQRDGPPVGWRYYSQVKLRSRLRGWLAQVWRGAKNNAALVSAFVALLGVLITLLINALLAQQEQERQQHVENLRAQRELELAERQAQQESLQTYLGDMGELLLRDTSPLREASAEDEVSRLARAKTLTVLLGLDGQSKTIVLQFLVEEELVQSVEGRGPIISLAGADLSGVDLSDANQLGADLSGADLREADLSYSNLSYSNLSDANLLAADLSNADLSGADLSTANISTAYLTATNLHNANLSRATLSYSDLGLADLRGAYLSGAALSGADLSDADLSDAQGVTKATLEAQDVRLAGATMPDGSEHP